MLRDDHIGSGSTWQTRGATNGTGALVQPNWTVPCQGLQWAEPVVLYDTWKSRAGDNMTIDRRVKRAHRNRGKIDPKLPGKSPTLGPLALARQNAGRRLRWLSFLRPPPQCRAAAWKPTAATLQRPPLGAPLRIGGCCWAAAQRPAHCANAHRWVIDCAKPALRRWTNRAGVHEDDQVHQPKIR